jgi:hypothetical protein
MDASQVAAQVRVADATSGWEQLQVTPSRVERHLLGHLGWYFGAYAVLPFAFSLLTAIGFSLRQGNISKDVVVTSVVDPLLDYTTWSLLIGMAVGAFLFARWLRTIPAFFQQLLALQSAGANGLPADERKRFDTFRTEYQAALLSRKRSLVTGLCVSTVAAVTLVAWWIGFVFPFPRRADLQLLGLEPIVGAPGASLLEHIGVTGQRLLIVLYFPGTVVVLSICAYLFGAVVWIMGSTGLSICRYVRRFGVPVWPKHPDRCGGVRFVGTFCVQMVLPLLAGISAYSLFYFGASLLVLLNSNFHIAGSVALRASARGVVVVAVPVTVAVLLVVTITALWPIWSVHGAMRAHQQVDEATFTRSAKRLTDEITAGLAANNLVQARAAKDELELVEAVHVPAENYPTWPFERRLFVRFVAPQVISVLGAVGSAVVQANFPHHF